MARPRKNLSTQQGHLTQEQQKEKELAEQFTNSGSDQLQKPPKWLRDATAKKEWKRLIEQYNKLGIITNLDLNNLGAYCNAYSFYRDATEELKTAPLTVEYMAKNGITNTIENPLIKIQIKYSDEMKRYSSLLGLTVDSRLKLGQIKLGKTDNKVTKEFGDI